jgi:DNA-binding transcriptional regulator YbjK
MRIHPLPVLALLSSIAALVAGGLEVGGTTPWMLFISAAACLVALSVFVLYLTAPTHRPLEVPVEDFSLWVDAGEPAKDLQKLGPSELPLATMVLRSDLGSIVSNSELLCSRLSIAVTKPELQDLAKFELVPRSRELLSVLRGAEASLSGSSSPETLRQLVSSLERAAIAAEAILRDLEGISLAKRGVGETYLLPLRRAIDRMVKDLKELKANTESYLRLFLLTSQSGGGVPPSS